MPITRTIISNNYIKPTHHFGATRRRRISDNYVKPTGIWRPASYLYGRQYTPYHYSSLDTESSFGSSIAKTMVGLGTLALIAVVINQGSSLSWRSPCHVEEVCYPISPYLQNCHLEEICYY